MKTFILVYEGFVQFEIVIASLFMKHKGEVITVALEEREVTSYEGFITRPHKLLRDVNIDDVNLFIIPGGDMAAIYDSQLLNRTLRQLNEKKKVIAAICAGPVHLGRAGILNGKRFTAYDINGHEEDFKNGIFIDEKVVIDDNIITAKPNGYVDFAIEIGKKMRVFKDQKELVETIDFYKYFKETN
ncbi:thij/pfpi family protein [Methanocella sp. CWC-04]|uniref:Thij/pfpi family protein n=1 Tax=Methanooceanicella nereidis TaxID=2052831 RepID=A0AAP2RES6_9EURY|nr:DJ-1/PfpI family protein [Methanocella sp. CWC-04]MCD1295220.1 thij/pfpi family protein [Methanocella sp. CWC-04]